jgi:RNA polymerase sigma-70 factor, ECF subfamily
VDPSPAPRLEVVPGGRAEPADWEAVYRGNVGPVYRFVYSRTGNRADAEDITALVFERALPRVSIDAGEVAVRAYLLACARSQLADHWRRRHGVAVLSESLAQPETPPHDDAAHDSEISQLLGRLPEHYRRVLELRFLRGYSLKETALAMETTVGNVKVLQLRALRRAAEDDR